MTDLNIKKGSLASENLLQLCSDNGISTDELHTANTNGNVVVMFTLADGIDFLYEKAHGNELGLFFHLLKPGKFNNPQKLIIVLKHFFFNEDRAKEFLLWQFACSPARSLKEKR